MKSRILYLAFSISIISSCSNVSEEDLIDSTPIVEEITYLADVKPIIDSNCTFCHSSPPVNGAPMSLVSYQDNVQAIEDRDLIERIETQDLGFVMPLGGPRLPQNLIDIIKQWEIDGLLEE